jgi:hypothetical protein
MFFVLSCWLSNLKEVINCFRQAFSAAIQSQGYLGFNDSVNCAVQFPAFSDTNKGLYLTCIQYIAEAAASVKALECCDDSQVRLAAGVR